MSTTKYIYITSGICSRRIFIELDDQKKITNVQFEGGCSGNTQGLSKMVCGLNAADVVKKLKGIKCGFKSSSCPDQLATALEQALEGNLQPQEF